MASDGRQHTEIAEHPHTAIEDTVIEQLLSVLVSGAWPFLRPAGLQVSEHSEDRVSKSNSFVLALAWLVEARGSILPLVALQLVCAAAPSN